MSTPTLDVPIPLIGGCAVIRFPTPVTADNVDLFEEAVAIQLAHFRKVLAAIDAESRILSSSPYGTETSDG